MIRRGQRGPAPRLQAMIFDTDGVVTRTATVHATAWKAVFDALLRDRAHDGPPARPFDDNDYLRFVDGRSRYDGVATFLASRGIDLPYGSADDAPGLDTVCALGNRKNERFVAEVQQHGVEPFESTLALIRTLRRNGIRTAVVSASENCAEIIASAGAADLFDTRVDGIDARQMPLAGKPDPALFDEAARRLSVAPSAAAVVEDALVGVEAAARGGFGLVVGVDRGGDANALLVHGADVVVDDLADFDVDRDGTWRVRSGPPTSLRRAE
jgi:HAD superfamily hydrolase (TIGR01509 family)